MEKPVGNVFLGSNRWTGSFPFIPVRWHDEKTKEKAAKTLAGMGISVSDAVRMLLIRVAAEEALPFEVRVPNASTVKAVRAADNGKGL